MNIWLIIYLIGCGLAFLIGLNEIAETEKRLRLYEEPTDRPQYGLFPIIIMLSWVVVFIWIYNKYTDKE